MNKVGRMVSKIDNVVEEVVGTINSKTIETRSQTTDHKRTLDSEVAMSAKVKILIMGHPPIKANEEAVIMTRGNQEDKTGAKRATIIEVEGLKDKLEEVEEGIGMIFRERSPTRTETTPLKIRWIIKKNKMKAMGTISLREPMASISRIEVAKEVVVDAALLTNEAVHTTREI